MAQYAKDTTVDSGASRAEIERTLARYGCDSFGYMSKPGLASIVFTIRGRTVKFTLPLPDPNAEEFRFTPGRRLHRSPEKRTEAYEQAVRQRWRALALCIKARLEAIEAGVETLDQAFLAHMLLAGGRTMAEVVEARLDEVIETGEVTLSLPGAAGAAATDGVIKVPKSLSKDGLEPDRQGGDCPAQERCRNAARCRQLMPDGDWPFPPLLPFKRIEGLTG